MIPIGSPVEALTWAHKIFRAQNFRLFWMRSTGRFWGDPRLAGFQVTPEAPASAGYAERVFVAFLGFTVAGGFFN